MELHYEPYTISDLWWILYKAFYHSKPIKVRGKDYYYSVPCAFDIETSSFIDINGEKAACMYIWMLGINGYCVIGRTWEELEKALKKISSYCGLGENVTLPIYVHNLAYEFQFIKDRFNWAKVFALDTRKPNYCKTDFGIEFRCSYQLSGMGLARVGKNLTKYKVRKMVGDLDYSKIRHSKTELTKEELQYCINDVLVVMAYIQECIDSDGDITKIPMTKTGYVRRYVKQECLGKGRKHNTQYQAFIKTLTLEPDEYLQLRRAFQGGFTHASALHSNMILEDVDSFDFTSSYPAVILSEKFPMSKSELITDLNKTIFYDSLKTHCCLFDAYFEDIEPIELYENYISYSRCSKLSNPVVNNGRIVSADSLLITLTEQDFMIIKRLYKWKNLKINNFRRYEKGYLPKKFINAVLKLYEDKTKLKDVEGQEAEYMLSKAMLNSCYGMMVTDICRNDITYEDGEWVDTKPDIEKSIEKYNKAKSRFLFYPWGVWVTAYARANLFTGIVSCGTDYVYSDTDSIKMLHGERHKDYIEKYNNMITNKLELAMISAGINIDRTKPKTINGIEKPIGVWDYEGHYKKFKTLGAKRYMWYDGNKMQITIAGLNKQIGLKYLQFGELSGKSIFDKFCNEMYIPKGWTGKQTHTYIDYEFEGLVCDYLGNVNEYHEKSATHLEETDFTLSLGAQYIEYLMGYKSLKV